MTTFFNRSLEEMRQFVLVLDKNGKRKLYHEVLDRLKTWFAEELGSVRGLKLYETYIHAMLRVKRTTRPRSLNIVHTLQTKRPFGNLVDHTCHVMLPAAPRLAVPLSADEKEKNGDNVRNGKPQMKEHGQASPRHSNKGPKDQSTQKPDEDHNKSGRSHRM
ncbi:hypothetical protein E8E12_003503 [Didymella heteroderae]|uniref:Uncharacterized protein n=1 Tax=Didymella heteroderae TaxID=1769908 RepID=A0A9P5C0Q2_9PLEO|nr:hypothetical protein E8E12_003503 [Didymella heteroderae]